MMFVQGKKKRRRKALIKDLIDALSANLLAHPRHTFIVFVFCDMYINSLVPVIIMNKISVPLK